MSSFLFSLGFCRSLSIREMLDITNLSSLIGEFDFELGECMFIFGALTFRVTSHVLSFPIVCWTLLPLETVFSALWKIMIPKKVKFFVWYVLHHRVNTLDWLSKKCLRWLAYFVASFVERWRKTMIISSGVVIMCVLCVVSL